MRYKVYPLKIIGAPGRSGGGGGDEDAARDSVGDRNLEREGEEQNEEGENEEEAAEDCTQSVSLSSDEESARDQEEGDTPPNESSGSSGMEGHSEPEVAAEKVKYLCGEDEDTLPDRFGDRKSQVQFGEKTAVIRDFG